MSVRAKFRLTEVTSVDWSPSSKRYKFTAVYDATIPEDVRFSKATPNGSLEMQIDNPQAQAQFELGKYYYFDALPCPN